MCPKQDKIFMFNKIYPQSLHKIFVWHVGPKMRRLLQKHSCKVIQHYRSLSKSSWPQNNVSYDKSVHYKDPFMKAEFQTMKDIAAMLTFFWNFRQIPFLSDLLEKLFRRFLELFVRKAVLYASVTSNQLIKVNIDELSEISVLLMV